MNINLYQLNIIYNHKIFNCKKKKRMNKRVSSDDIVEIL
jgi:hypothetical protein